MLYLDTARLGRMSPKAQHAQVDFARLAGEEGSSSRFERFLRTGFEPDECQYPGLSDWRGIPHLKQSLRQLAGSRDDLPVLLANRSVLLMRLAACLLFHRCHNVLVLDLGWPAYHDILQAKACSIQRCVTIVPIRDAILQGKIGGDELVERIRNDYRRHHCDGLFLPAVSNLGPRIPIERIVNAVNGVREARFVVIDGAQDFCHVSADIRNEYCDLYLTGSHKWLAAYHPMGLAFYGRRRSQSYVEMKLAALFRTGEIDDPLLRFSFQMESEDMTTATETVNLAAMFSCQGAISDISRLPANPCDRLAVRLANLAGVESLAVEAGWRSVAPGEELRTGILLLQAERPASHTAKPAATRDAFYDRGVALTAYPEGLVRLSMPDRPFDNREWNQLQTAFRAVANGTA